MRTPEFFQAKRKRRDALRQYLPTDLQLEGEIKPTKWSFDGKLLTRRKLDAEEYQKFFEIIKLQNKSKSLTADEKVKLEELQKESMMVKREIGESIYHQGVIKKGLEQLAKRGRWNGYVNLLKTAVEVGVISDPNTIKQGLEQLAKQGWRNGYASLLKTAVEVGVISDLNAIKQGLEQLAELERWDYYASLLKTAVEKRIILDPSKHSQEMSFIKEIINKEENKGNSSYLYTLISQKLLEGESLDKFFQEEYNDYLNLKVQSEQWNDNLDDTKKVKDVNTWWEKYQVNFAELQALDRKLAIALALSFKDKGLLALQSYLKIYDEVLSNEGIRTSVKNLIKRQENFLPDQLDKLLQTAHAYKKMGKVADFQEILTREEDFQATLDHHLVEILAESLEIKLDKQGLSLDGWNKKYISNLTSNEEMIKQINDNDNTLHLYKEMLKATFENRFNEFITSNNQESGVGRDIAQHNQHIKEVYDKLGIYWEKWLDYKKTQDFVVETEKEVKAFPRFIALLKERAEKVREEIAFLKQELTEREYLPLVHLLDGAKDKALGDLQDHKKLKERYDNFVRRINILKEKYPNLDFSSIAEHAGHLKEAIDLFQEKDKTETETFSKGFRVKLWDRDPRRDLFQGNYTHCCIAVGVKPGEQEGGLNTHDPSTVMQFLVDKGIQIAEVLDESKEDPIAQVWLFVSKDKLGEPVLIVDNFEVHSDYVSDVFINNKIRDNMFEFLRDYAKAINIPKVGLAQVGTNDVDYSKIKSFAIPPIDKVGGYLKDYTLDVAGRSGRYYLEAYNNHNLAEIMNEQVQEQEKKEERNGMLNIIDLGSGAVQSIDSSSQLMNDIVNGRMREIFNEANYEELRGLEAGYGDMTDSLENVIKGLTNPRGIQFLF